MVVTPDPLSLEFDCPDALMSTPPHPATPRHAAAVAGIWRLTAHGSRLTAPWRYEART